ncbi:VOC family protein [soil metagenome]
MSIQGIDEITYGADDLPTCRQFFLDWGLDLVAETSERLTFETMNGCRVIVASMDSKDLPPGIEEGKTLREVVWGCDTEDDLATYTESLRDAPGFVESTVEGARRVGATDPNGLAMRVQVTRKRQIEVESGASNTFDRKGRVNRASPIYERATPVEVGHVVFFVKDVMATEQFYVDRLGFVASDRYPGKGAFLRCSPEGGHHDLFLLQPPTGKAGLNHVAFAVRDIHEVFGGGLHVSRCGWDTQLGPGRHPVSSAYFWYFKSPAGGLIEYYADDDHLTAEWEPREFEPGPTVFAEWAVDGGIDGHTRRQRNAEAPTGKFLTEKK